MDSSPASTRRHGTTPFIIRRTFAAPRDRVWRAWTEASELKQWFGPKGFTMPVCNLDLRPGGTCHYCMRSADGAVEMWGKWTFLEVVAPSRLSLVMCFSDAQGGISRHPMSATWPQRTRSITTFTEVPGGTEVEVQWSVYDGTDEENQTFDAAHPSMNQGWSGTFTQLTDYLANS